MSRDQIHKNLTFIGERVNISHCNTPRDTSTALFFDTVERDPIRYKVVRVINNCEFYSAFVCVDDFRD